MAISKKQAKQIANLINSCTCWTIAVKDELQKTEPDNKKVREFMGYHDQYAKELNDILGTIAVFQYNMEAL
jgi:predicted transcriptional regulator